MTVRHSQAYKDKHKLKHPDANAPPSPPALKAPPKSDSSDEIVALKAELASLRAAHENLKSIFKFATGHSVDQNGNVEPVIRKA